jgi:hypothetical protein
MAELRVLEDLGEEFRGLPTPPGRGVPVPGRMLIAAVLLVLLLAGVATAAILISRGAPLPAAHVQDLESNGVPIPASAHLAGLDVPDPDPAAPPWDLRISRTRDGETCTAVGQVLGGQFGIVGLDHVFRPLPLGGVDACGVEAPDGPVLAGARVFVGGLGSEARTIVNGLAGAGARSVTAYGPEGARRLRLGPQGSFIAVYRGYVEEVRPRIVVVTRDGHSHSLAFAASAAFETPDPGGGSPWQVSGEADLEPGAYPDENCAQASQELGREDPSRVVASLTPSVCGRLAVQPLFVLMRRFVPGSGEGSQYPWGNNPARTLVYGAAAPRVAGLTLSGFGGSRAVAIDPHGDVFLAVLDGHVDPRSLTLTARLRDGREIPYRGSANLLAPRGNRPIAEAPVPAYREPLPTSQAEPPPFEIPVQSTVRETLHAADPAGGPEWALRSWQGVPNPRARFGGHAPSRFVCIQVGVVRDGRLVQERPGKSPLPLSAGEEGGGVGGCNEASYAAHRRPVMQVESFTEHPFAYEPQPTRTVVAGTLPNAARDALLLGAGKPRPVHTDANHAFLLVLPGRYWHAPLRISIREGNRTIVPSASSTLPVPVVLAVPQARAPDPDGGAPWGTAATPGATSYGRILDGRLAYISESDGAVNYGPAGYGSNGGDCSLLAGRRHCGLGGGRPVEFDAQSESEEGFPRRSTVLTPPQIERRTLPGRTIITGRADAEVVSITLATPRDVRTLRPAGPQHVFIVVYDGQFFRGDILATILLRDGRTITQPVPDGGSEPLPPERLSLARLLAGDRRQLALVDARRGHRPAGPGNPTTQLEGSARTIERRIAYERAHPGVLPGS